LFSFLIFSYEKCNFLRMNLKNISDEILLENTEALVQKEREVLGEVLWHLNEIDRRRLFSAFGYSSLFQYAVERLRYSEDQAYRRISAARLLQEVPEVECKIADGSLSLSNVSMVQTLFRRERTVHTEKVEILTALENKSAREAKKIVQGYSSRVPEKAEISADVQEKIQRLKGLLAHSHPHLSTNELLHLLCDLGLKEWDPGKKEFRVKQSPWTSKVESKNPRFISAELKRKIWRRAGSQCEHCGSHYALEIDHCVPVPQGGGSTEENLRLLCRACNQRAAIEHFGIEKMQKYLNAS
jgi:hypothetical protein